MVRKIIQIDEEACNGCGLCATACHEGAIAMVDGKAKLIREDYCDGLGNCLPVCPTGAITFIEKDAPAFDEKAVEAHLKAGQQAHVPDLPCGCPGSAARTLSPASINEKLSQKPVAQDVELSSQLRQWPVQIQLVPVNAPYFNGAHLLIAADCAAYAHGNFHNEFMKGRITIIGCPKLDSVEYSQKLTQILVNNNIKSVIVVRMEVPCCGGLAYAATEALKNCGKMIPWSVVTLTTDGDILVD